MIYQSSLEACIETCEGIIWACSGCLLWLLDVVSTSQHGVPARPAKLACAGTTTVQGIASSAPQTNYGGDIALSWEPTFQSCLTTCSTTAGCVDVSPRPAAVEMGRVRSDIRIWGGPTGFVSSCSHCCLVHVFNSDAYPTYCGSLINSISTLRRLHSCLWPFYTRFGGMGAPGRVYV
jgi:hypothetical protein